MSRMGPALRTTKKLPRKSRTARELLLEAGIYLDAEAEELAREDGARENPSYLRHEATRRIAAALALLEG